MKYNPQLFGKLCRSEEQKPARISTELTKQPQQHRAEAIQVVTGCLEVLLRCLCIYSCPAVSPSRSPGLGWPPEPGLGWGPGSWMDWVSACVSLPWCPVGAACRTYPGSPWVAVCEQRLQPGPCMPGPCSQPWPTALFVLKSPPTARVDGEEDGKTLLGQLPMSADHRKGISSVFKMQIPSTHAKLTALLEPFAQSWLTVFTQTRACQLNVGGSDTGELKRSLQMKSRLADIRRILRWRGRSGGERLLALTLVCSTTSFLTSAAPLPCLNPLAQGLNDPRGKRGFYWLSMSKSRPQIMQNKNKWATASSLLPCHHLRQGDRN